MIALYILLALIGAAIIFYFLPTLIVANVIYTVLLVRTNKNKWSRSLSWDDEEQQKMFDIGIAWFDENKSFQKRLTVKSGKFNLVGEYFDFGFKKAVIIIPGRMESCLYSGYFAKPYKEIGYNVLAIDNRSHGLSDGRYNTIGIKEYKDLLAWSELLNKEHGVESIVFHGICIGAATAIYALALEDKPYFKALVAEGVYVHFKEMLKQQLKSRKKPQFPARGEVLAMLSIVAGKSVVRHGPVNYVSRVKKPILFIYSKQDVLSPHEKAMEMYERATNEKKKIVFFDKGIHSHIRINATELYDETVKSFITEIENE